MSAKLELVRGILADWQQGNYTATEWAAPEIVFTIVDGPAPGTWHGVSGMRAGWRSFLHSWESFHGETVRSIEEVGGESVLVVHGFYGRGRTSGLEVKQADAATLFDVRDGRVTRLRVYFDRQRAKEDLEPPPDRP